MAQLFSCGYRLEHFTNWDNSGFPGYYSVGLSDTYESHGLGYIQFYDNMDNVTYKNVLWDELNSAISNTNIWLTFEVNLLSVSIPGLTARSSFNINLIGSDNNVIGLNLQNIDSSYNGGNATIYDATYSTSSRLTKGTSTSLGVPSSSEGRYFRYHINLTKSSGVYNQIAVYRESVSAGTITTAYSGSMTGSLSDIKSVLIFTNTGAGSSSHPFCNFYYYAITDTDTRNSYLEGSYASAIGTTNQFSGSSSTLSTYPVTYSVGSGFYSSTTNTSVSFTQNKSLNSIPSGYMALSLINSAAAFTTSENTISQYVYNGGTSKISSDTSTLSTTGNGIRFYNSVDPITGHTLSSTSLNYEYGITLVS